MIRAAKRFTVADQQRHSEASRISSELTQIFRRMYRPTATMIPHDEIIKLLNGAGVKFVLMGTHGVGGWRSEPRATQDVDVLVRPAHHRKAVRTIRKAYPDLIMDDQIVVTRFTDPATGFVILDLMRPYEKVLKAVFKNTKSVGRTHRIPDLEMSLATKYAAMVSPNRTTKKKYTDANDFMDIVEYHQNDIDLAKLKRLGEKVYRGGGAEILKYVEDAKAGRQLEL